MDCPLDDFSASTVDEVQPQESESSQILRQVQDCNTQVFTVPPIHVNIQETRHTPSFPCQTVLTSRKLVSLQKQLKTLKRKCIKLQSAKRVLKEEVKALTQRLEKAEQTVKTTNIELLLDQAEEGRPKALFLQQQLRCLKLKKHHWSEETVRLCIQWHSKSPCAYQLVRASEALSLPSRSTLKRYVGPCTGEEMVSSLMKQRLHQEAKLHSELARHGSLVMDEMSIKQGVEYQREGDSVHGLVQLGGLETQYEQQDEVATHLLCFVFVGLSSHYRLPVGYYFTKALTGQQLHQLGLEVMRSVEDAGFTVLRLVGDNHASNCKYFSTLSGGKITPVVSHPLDKKRKLFLAFDPCHILKNIRSQFLASNRFLCNNGKYITPKYVRGIYDLQQKQGAFTLVRGLSRKHVFPSNFEKMNVKRALDVVSPQVTSVLRYLQRYGTQFGIFGFEDCLPTIEFVELVYKWFSLHNIRSSTFHIFSKDPMRMPFYDANDERLSWLENDLLDYFLVWKDSAPAKAAFLSEETYEALCITTASTVPCTRHLLDRGFHFVLTSRYSSDDVEALFSTVRQLNGQNDQTDARAALSSLQKILVTGLLHSSKSGNTSHTIGTLGDLKKLASTASSTASRPVGLADILRPYTPALEMLPGTPQPGLQASTLGLVAGFLVRAVQDNISCLGCLDTVKAPASSSPTTALIVNIDRGGLSYPRLSFVGLVINLEKAASASVTALLKSKRPVQQFLGAVLPALCRNPLLQCEHDSSEDHRRALATVIVRKFMRPFLVNHTRNVSERKRKKKNLKGKPESRKVLKV
ncbi:LOW QUALITY PROTEIN: uncharacterized protein LOC120850237 [Ixodes scapularis]|uniref:LOW QUALITY PROTEIN: uncharacterized protein LOC120850237 n=1 Tax=Ixodes scapularis TaxID=6945 RepID=UPI001C3824E4|nr:LOW QUALITY PROTEIN: uncharacterized protein LOC120850237 [Ixodes scapularis]